MVALNIIADDRNLITYRPKLRKLTGSVTAAILLQQIMFWYYKTHKPFYKYKMKPEKNENDKYPEKYKEGDSWCEELGFGKSEFETALKKIAKKVKKGQPKPKDCFVWYWTNMSRETYYEVNSNYLNKCLVDLYKSEINIYVNNESISTKITNQYLDNTEITSKNTSDNLIESQNLKVSDIPNFQDLKKNESKKTEKSNDLKYIDFRNNLKLGKLGQAKGLLQEHLNLLIFSTSDDKAINTELEKIKQTIRQYNKSKSIFTNVTDKQVVNAFKLCLESFIERVTNIEQHSLSYFLKCISPNTYLNNNSIDLEPYKQIVKSTFKHYTNFNNVEKNYLNQIIKAMKEYYQNKPNTTILSEFKYFFNRLPQYVFKSVHTQSLSYVNKHISDLLRKTDIRNHPKYDFYVSSWGEETAIKLLSNLQTN